MKAEAMLLAMLLCLLAGWLLWEFLGIYDETKEKCERQRLT